MTIVTTAATAATTTKSSRLSPGNPWHLATGSALATLLCFCLPRRRRVIPVLFCLLLACSFPPRSAAQRILLLTQLLRRQPIRGLR